jgi:hypothetical protein
MPLWKVTQLENSSKIYALAGVNPTPCPQTGIFTYFRMITAVNNRPINTAASNYNGIIFRISLMMTFCLPLGNFDITALGDHVGVS